MAVTVREARAGDAPRIAAVNMAGWEAAYRGIVADAYLDSRSLERRTAAWTELLKRRPRVPVNLL